MYTASVQSLTRSSYLTQSLRIGVVIPEASSTELQIFYFACVGYSYVRGNVVLTRHLNLCCHISGCGISTSTCAAARLLPSRMPALAKRVRLMAPFVHVIAHLIEESCRGEAPPSLNCILMPHVVPPDTSSPMERVPWNPKSVVC